MKRRHLFLALLLGCFVMAFGAECTVKYAYSADKNAIEINVACPNVPQGSVCALSAQDLENPDLTYSLGTYALGRKGAVKVTKNTSEFPERRKLRVTAVIHDGNGNELRTGAVDLTTPPLASHWENFTEGIPGDTVPFPWTSVMLEDRTVSVWGRKFIFKESPLPAQIVSQGVKLLTEPAELLLEPAPEKWELTRAVSVNDTTARMEWEGILGNGKKIIAVVEIYFDGVMRLDMTFPEGLSVSRYAQVYKIDRAVARTLHRGPWAFGGIKTTYPVKECLDEHPIRPQLFLFNDEVGFGWFDGMQFDWPLINPGSALTVEPEDNNVVFTVNYIDGLATLQKERIYSTGLQPLPVRPMPEKQDGLRMCYAVTYNDINLPAWLGTVDYSPEGNFRLESGTAEMSVKLDFDPSGHQREELFWEANHGLYLRFKLGWAADGGIFAQLYEDCITKAYVKSGVHPKKGEWHHVAVTWDEDICLYVDGQLAGSAPYKGCLRAFPVQLQAGGQSVHVDSLRISAKPRTEFSIGEELVADEDTLLLDNFEKTGFCNGRRATFPERISDEAEAGYPTPDAHLGEGRWGQGIAPMRHPVRNLLEGYRYYGIDVFCFHASQYTDEAMAGMYIDQPDQLRKTVEEIHRLGGRAIMYLNNSLSNFDRAWDAHRDDWLIEPKGYPFVPPGRPDEKSFQACPRSDYINYFFWRLAEDLDEFNLDGGFLDGRMYTTCHNTRHGCEVENFEGKRIAKRDVWDGRLKAWRLYNIIKARNGYCEQHKSSIWDAPTCFFWDAAWEGEQFMMQTWEPNQGKRTAILPIEAMRSQMNGFVYGLPSRLTAYNMQPFKAEDYCTYSFVHGTTWTMTYRINEAAVTSPYWHALDDFGATYHNFHPYWGKVPPVSEVPDPLIKVSAYVKDSAALLIVANFNEEAPRVTGKIRFEGASLGVSGPWRAADAFSGEEISISDDGELPIDVKSFRQQWIRIESRKE